MKNRIIAIVAALLLTLLTVPMVSVCPVRAQSANDLTTPEGYNEHDYNAIVSFLEQTNEEGVKNGIYLNPAYDPENPETWINEDMESGIYWTEQNGEKMLFEVYMRYGFYGSLNLSGCEALTTALCMYDMLTDADFSDCPVLEYVSVESNPILTELDVSNCPSIQRLIAGSTQVTEIDLSDKSALTGLFIAISGITDVDLSNCSSLREIECSQSSIRTLDFSNCRNIGIIHCWGCGLEELILPQEASNLSDIWCMMNELTELDLSGCNNLLALYCYANHLTNLDLTNCRLLRFLACSANELTELDVSCCPDLEQLFTAGNHLSDLDLSSNPNLPLDVIRAEGKGEIGYNFEFRPTGDMSATAVAAPLEGESFIGWYNEAGVMLSTDMEFDFSSLVGIEKVLIARFTGGEALPGDVDGSGEVNITDALLALRAAMGVIELTPEQLAAADMNGSGTAEVSDAIIILRMAMGLLN